MSDPAVVAMYLRSIEHELRRIADALEALVRLEEERLERTTEREEVLR